MAQRLFSLPHHKAADSELDTRSRKVSFNFEIQPGWVKLVLWRRWMHVNSGASSGVREAISLHQAVWLWRTFWIHHMQNSAPSWITVVRHLESCFASFATSRWRCTCTCTSIQILAKFAAWSCESFDGFPWTFRCRSVWIHKLVAVRVAMLDTSGPTATSCGDVVSAEAGKEGAAWWSSTWCGVLHDDGELSFLSRLGLPKVVDCLPAEPSSLGTPSRGFSLGVLMDVDRQS